MAFSWGSLPWGDIIKSGVQLGTSIYGANQARNGAQAAAQQATPVPWSGSSPYGTSTFNPNTKSFSLTPGQNPFSQIFNVGGMQSLGNAFSAPGSAYYGAAPEVTAAAGALGGQGQADEAAGRLSALRQIAQPWEQRAQNSLNDRLFSMGTAGTTGGGIQQTAFQEAQNDADLKRTLAAQDWAQSRSMDRFSTAMQAVGQGGQMQQQQYNIGSGSLGNINNLFQMLMNQANVGVGSAAGAPPQLASQANQSTFNSTILPFLQNSGAFDALGNWIGGGGNQATPAPAQSPYGPYSGGYQFPTGNNHG
jgi:hypothetical protein